MLLVDGQHLIDTLRGVGAIAHAGNLIASEGDDMRCSDGSEFGEFSGGRIDGQQHVGNRVTDDQMGSSGSKGGQKQYQEKCNQYVCRAHEWLPYPKVNSAYQVRRESGRPPEYVQQASMEYEKNNTGSTLLANGDAGPPIMRVHPRNTIQVKATPATTTKLNPTSSP